MKSNKLYMRDTLVPLKTPAVFEREKKSKNTFFLEIKNKQKKFNIMKVNVRKADKADLKELAKNKEVQNNKEKVMHYVSRRSAYGELRY